MKIKANIIRPIIFFLCGLGYLPLQSADSKPKLDSQIEKKRSAEAQKTKIQKSKTVSNLK